MSNESGTSPPGRSLLLAVPLVLALAVWIDDVRLDDMLLATDETAVTAAAREAPGRRRATTPIRACSRLL